MLKLRIDASFSRHRPMFGPRSGLTGFVVNKLVLLGAFLRGVWIVAVNYHFTCASCSFVLSGD